jgi:hypothetical protein
MVDLNSASWNQVAGWLRLLAVTQAWLEVDQSTRATGYQIA